MKRVVAKSATSSRVSWVILPLVLLGSSVLVTSLLAQSEGSPAAQNSNTQTMTAPVKPNYDLASRFMPEKISKLVFDVSVTPHWFELSDRFWYSFETPEGTRYWIVDPVKKTKTPLWDNAKVAATLSTLTNIPFDAQHLPVRNLKLVDKDTAIRFEVEVSKDDTIPNETKKATTDEDQDTDQENNGDQNQTRQTSQRGGRGGRGAAGAPPPGSRTIYFEYELASGNIKRLDAFDAPPKKPTWASVSPDEKVIVFARGENLYMMDADNFKKAEKKADDASVTETQLTTDGIDRYSYARVLLPEDEDQLKKDDKGDAKNKIGMRRPAIQIHWSKDSKKFALVRRDERKVGELWVIHTLASPRPILETYSYSMPGDDNVRHPGDSKSSTWRASSARSSSRRNSWIRRWPLKTLRSPQKTANKAVEAVKAEEAGCLGAALRAGSRTAPTNFTSPA